MTMTNSSKTQGLGKGLGALLAHAVAEEAQNSSVPRSPEASVSPLDRAPQNMAVTQLQPSSVQPRKFFDEEALKSLCQSIKSQGVLTPLLVRPFDGKYEIIAGERRWRASQMAGLTEVPVIILDLDDGKALEVALVENVQRADLNPIDEAEGYLRLVNEFNYTHEDMARVTGKSRSHITNLLRLLSLPQRLKECVSEGLLTMGHARALLGLSDDEALQLRAANKIIKSSLSVREAEDLVRKLADPQKSTRGRKPKDMATMELEKRIHDRLGLQVKIQQKEGTGTMRVFFENQSEFTALLKKLGVA